MCDMDTANVGHLSNEKVYQIMVEQMKLQQEVFSLKRLSLDGVPRRDIFLAATTLGSNFAAATLAKDTDVKNGKNLAVKTDSSLVGSKSRRSHLVATVDMAYVRRLHRRMLGFETEDDRRVLQQEGSELVATVPFQELHGMPFLHLRRAERLSLSLRLFMHQSTRTSSQVPAFLLVRVS